MLDMLREMGWLVVEVEGLSAEAAYVDDCGVLLIRAGADPESLRQTVDWLLLGDLAS